MLGVQRRPAAVDGVPFLVSDKNTCQFHEHGVGAGDNGDDHGDDDHEGGGDDHHATGDHNEPKHAEDK